MPSSSEPEKQARICPKVKSFLRLPIDFCLGRLKQQRRSRFTEDGDRCMADHAGAVVNFIRDEDHLARWAARDRPYDSGDPDERRTAFKHDGDEVVYSLALRRLSHKSQVVVKPETHDHYRSRLTHTLEVNQIAESIGRPLRLNIPLINAIALGHDVGHSPFGHAGERALVATMRADVLGLKSRDREETGKRFQALYGLPAPLDFGHGDSPKNDHWLFHHALNSVRLIRRKMTNVSEETLDGILKHSWSPWQNAEKMKFGVPATYEGQVVAIADQVAGINHDTEDILNCPESQFGLGTIRDSVPEYMVKHGEMQYNEARRALDEWFLSGGPGECREESGWSRKKRLQKILNSVVDASLPLLTSGAGAVPDDAMNPDKCLRVPPEMEAFLRGYEGFIHDSVIGGVSWFQHRDAVAAAVVRTAYTFYMNYASAQTGVDAPDSLTFADRVRQQGIQTHLLEYRTAVDEGNYTADPHSDLLMQAISGDDGARAERAIHAVDYVAGMTDGYIMHVFNLALELFR